MKMKQEYHFTDFNLRRIKRLQQIIASRLTANYSPTAKPIFARYPHSTTGMAKRKNNNSKPPRRSTRLRTKRKRFPQMVPTINRKKVTSRKKARKVNQTRAELRESPVQRTLSRTCLLARQSDDSQAEHYAPLQRQPRHTFKDIGGLKSVKEALLDSIVYPFAHFREAEAFHLSVPKAVLLKGRPGTGKTSLADAVVSEIRKEGRNIAYFEETTGCLNKFVGETEKNIRTLFAKAKEHAPAIILMDEIEGLGRQRNQASLNEDATLIPTLLTELNNVVRGEVLVIAATNCPQMVDPALIRKGRFDVTLAIPDPTREERLSILKLYLEKRDIVLKAKMIDAILNDGRIRTGADIESFVDSVHRQSMKRVFPNGSYKTAFELGKRVIEEKKASIRNIQNSDIEAARKLLSMESDSQKDVEEEEE